MPPTLQHSLNYSSLRSVHISPKWALRKCPLESSSSTKQNPSPRPSDDAYWQTKESLEEKILVRAGFVYTIEKRSGQVKVDVVNIGMHPIYVESVSVEVPCELRKEERSSTPEDCQYYLVPIY